MGIPLFYCFLAFHVRAFSTLLPFTRFLLLPPRTCDPPFLAPLRRNVDGDERQSRCPSCGQGCVAPLDLLSMGGTLFDKEALCRMGKGECCGDACPHHYGGYIPRAPLPQIPTGERFLSAYLRQYGTGKRHRATAAAVFSCKRHVREKSKSNDRGSKADCVGYGTTAIPSSPTRAGSAPQRRKRFHRVRLQRQT